MFAGLRMFAVEVQQFQQGVQPPVDAANVSKNREEQHCADRQKYNGRLCLNMKTIKVIKRNENKEDHEKVDGKIARAPVIAARQFQKLQALLRFAQFHLRQNLLLFRRQFSDEVFGEHEV